MLHAGHAAAKYPPASINPNTETDRDLRICQLVAPEAWHALAPAIRKRFTKHVKAGQSTIYQGRIVETRMNRAGFALARLLELLGGPLPLERGGGGAAAIVTVTEDKAGYGQYWTRQYNRQTGFPQVIHSTKRFAGPTGLEEHIGHGIGMTLRIEAQPTSLLFLSERYFATLFGKRIYLPAWLTPGKLTVGHHARADGGFDFTLDMAHPLFGELVHQRVDFHDMDQAA